MNIPEIRNRVKGAIDATKKPQGNGHAKRFLRENDRPAGDDIRTLGFTRDRRVRRVYGGGCRGLLGEVRDWLRKYIFLTDDCLLAVSAWVMAAWLARVWDRFPHVGITSPEMRCGKTRLLELLKQICPNANFATSLTGPALYRSMGGKDLPTLLMDEAQSLARRGSEASEVLREIFCGSISKDATVKRCVGPNFTPTDFPIYCPKVVALIGKLDGVLADRCLPVPMRRITNHDRKVVPGRMSVIEAEGLDLAVKLLEWSVRDSTQENARTIYNALEVFPIANARMAELLLPLQTVAILDASPAYAPASIHSSYSSSEDGQPDALRILHAYAHGLDESAREPERQSSGVRLLSACRDIWATEWAGKEFLPTRDLLRLLLDREDEGWTEFPNGNPLTAEKLRNLLGEYDIRPTRDGKQTCRGYYRKHFVDAWSRYLPAAGQMPVGRESPR
jgi:hypothetical protein